MTKENNLIKEVEEETGELMYWAYRLTNGQIKVRRFFGHDEMRETVKSDFVDDYDGPITAKSMKEASIFFQKALKQ